MEEGGGQANGLQASDSESDDLGFTRRGAAVGRTNGSFVPRTSRLGDGMKSSVDGRSDRRRYSQSGVCGREKGKVEDLGSSDEYERRSGGESSRKRFASCSSRSRGRSEVLLTKNLKTGHGKGNAENGSVGRDKRLSQRFVSADSFAGSDDVELIRNSIDGKKLSKLLGSHHMLPAAGTDSSHSDRKRINIENGEVGIWVQGKGGVLKLLPNKRMKLDVYEQSCELKEAEGSRRLLLSDSHRNALVCMGKKLNGRPVVPRPVPLVNKINGPHDFESEVDDTSSSGTKSGSISDGHTELMGGKKKINTGPASIYGKGKKNPLRTYHPDKKKEVSFRKGGLKGKLKKSVATENNHLNRASKLNRKAKAAILDPDDHLSSSHESGSVDLGNKRGNSLMEVTSIRKSKNELKNGRQTEKQILRDEIKNMLTEAGWTIDLRPRRGRTYHDHVYVSPSGTEYWSITNAYHALEKQYNSQRDQLDRSDNRENKSFSRIPSHVLSMLTRNTKKKMREQLSNKNLKHDKGVKNVKNIKSESVKRVNLFSSAKRKGKLKEKVIGNTRLGRMASVSLSEESIDSEQDKSASINHEKAVQSVRASKSFADSDVRLGKKNVPKKRYALLARGSNKEENPDANESLRYPGKLTVLSWLIDSGTVPENGKVQYMNRRRTKALLDGWITREGIHCSCCSKILSVSKFEIHAGSKLRQPFQNIFVKSGVPLLQCQLEAWNLQKETDREEFHHVETDGDDPNDDTCGICGDGGNLICCDGCPSTFHQGCLNVKVLPHGDWHCPNCSCKFCGVTDLANDSLYSCSQCERKYHQTCTGETTGRPHRGFCGKSCKKLFEQLRKLLGIKKDLEGGYSWSLYQRMDGDSEGFPRGQSQRIEWNSKLAVALAVMDQCFLPIVDRRSGINMIHNVVYSCGSNFSRLNYCGFYTVILERGDEIISAASIRIHGTGLAEMPFIGTRHMYRRQGMCRRLLNAIESVLCLLNIEKLIIPSVPELMHTWTEIFGFKPVEDSHRQEMKSMSLIVFPGTDMLQKPLFKPTNADSGRVDDLNRNSGCDMHAELNEPSASFPLKLEAPAVEEGVVEHDKDSEEVRYTVDDNCQNGVIHSTIPLEPMHILSGSGSIDAHASPARSTASGTVPHSVGSTLEHDSETSAENLVSPEG